MADKKVVCELAYIKENEDEEGYWGYQPCVSVNRSDDKYVSTQGWKPHAANDYEVTYKFGYAVERDLDRRLEEREEHELDLKVKTDDSDDYILGNSEDYDPDKDPYYNSFGTRVTECSRTLPNFGVQSVVPKTASLRIRGAGEGPSGVKKTSQTLVSETSSQKWKRKVEETELLSKELQSEVANLRKENKLLRRTWSQNAMGKGQGALGRMTSVVSKIKGLVYKAFGWSRKRPASSGESKLGDRRSPGPRGHHRRHSM